MLVKSYRDLLVWQKAVELVADCYELTKQLPKSETYGLAGQIQRAAVSVPANIARDMAENTSATICGICRLQTDH